MRSFSVQLGIINHSDYCNVFQVGLINRSEDLYGFQIGIVNIIRNSTVPFFPLMNIGF